MVIIIRYASVISNNIDSISSSTKGYFTLISKYMSSIKQIILKHDLQFQTTTKLSIVLFIILPIIGEKV